MYATLSTSLLMDMGEKTITKL